MTWAHLSNVHLAKPRTFKCGHCDASFDQIGAKTTHEHATHNKSKLPYVCSFEGCNFGFRFPAHVRRRLRRRRTSDAQRQMETCGGEELLTISREPVLHETGLRARVERGLVVHQAQYTTKRRALWPFSSSLEYDVVSFRRRSISAPLDYSNSHLKRRILPQPVDTALSNSETPPSPELLLAANPPKTDEVLLFTPPSHQMSQRLCLLSQTPVPEVFGTTNVPSFVPNDDDNLWIDLHNF